MSATLSAMENVDDDKQPKALELLRFSSRSDLPVEHYTVKDSETDILREQTEATLSSSLDDATKRLLFFAGLNLDYQNYRRPVYYYLHVFWNIFIIGGSLLAYTVFPVVVIGEITSLGEMNIFLFFAFFVMFLQSIPLAWMIYGNYRRLNEKALMIEVAAYEKLLPEILWITAVLVIVSMPIFVLTGGGIAYLLFGMVFESTSAGVCLLFLEVDAEVCLNLISRGIRKSEDNTLTLAFVQEIRLHISARIAKHNQVNSALIAVAVLNLCAVMIFAFYFDSPEFTVGIFFAFFFRELAVAFVAFWKVAQVNETSKRLVEGIAKSLESTVWLHSLENNDLRQLQLFLTLSGNPIYYPLAGAVLTRRDVLIRFALWLLGTAIGLLHDQSEKQL
jgi:hypothetical protein